MGFFNKLKKGLGLDTASIKFIETPAEVSSSAKEITGKVTVTAQSDQKVNVINVTLREIHTDPMIDERSVGKPDKNLAFTLLDGFDIKQGETRTFPFTLVLSGALVSNPRMWHIKYELIAVADLEHVALDPVATLKIDVS